MFCALPRGFVGLVWLGGLSYLALGVDYASEDGFWENDMGFALVYQVEVHNIAS